MGWQHSRTHARTFFGPRTTPSESQNKRSETQCLRYAYAADARNALSGQAVTKTFPRKHRNLAGVSGALECLRYAYVGDS